MQQKAVKQEIET